MTVWDIDTSVLEKYVPERRQGGKMANQIATAVYRIVRGWYYNGDVYDNTYCDTFTSEGCGNDISNEANWLYRYADETAPVLVDIKSCESSSDYEALLNRLVELVNSEEYLEEYSHRGKCGDIYDCDGPFRFERPYSHLDADMIDDAFTKVDE